MNTIQPRPIPAMFLNQDELDEKSSADSFEKHQQEVLGGQITEPTIRDLA